MAPRKALAERAKLALITEVARMHLLMAIGTLVWFLLVGLLWYVRPGDVAWLLGSLALGALYITAFWWYVTRPE